MALTDFFRINMPYGIKQNSKGQWFAFNREYMPLGWNDFQFQQTMKNDDAYGELPIFTSYENLTDEVLMELADKHNQVCLDDNGKINQIFLYNDNTNPQSNPHLWDEYFNKIIVLSSLKVNGN